MQRALTPRSKVRSLAEVRAGVPRGFPPCFHARLSAVALLPPYKRHRASMLSSSTGRTPVSETARFQVRVLGGQRSTCLYGSTAEQRRRNPQVPVRLGVEAPRRCSPTGRGTGLRVRVMWVRIPPAVRRRCARQRGVPCKDAHPGRHRAAALAARGPLNWRGADPGQRFSIAC